MKVEYKAALRSNDIFRDKPVEWSGDFTREAEMIAGNLWKGMLIDKGDAANQFSSRELTMCVYHVDLSCKKIDNRELWT